MECNKRRNQAPKRTNFKPINDTPQIPPNAESSLCSRDFYEAIRLARLAFEASTEILQEHPVIKALCKIIFDFLPQIVESVLASTQTQATSKHGFTS